MLKTGRENKFDFRVIYTCTRANMGGKIGISRKRAITGPMHSNVLHEIPRNIVKCKNHAILYIRVYNGSISFGYLYGTDDPTLMGKDFIKRKKARFYRVPKKIGASKSCEVKPTHVSFNSYSHTKKGHEYEEPMWHFISSIHSN